MLKVTLDSNMFSLHWSVWGLRYLCPEARVDNPASAPADKTDQWDLSNTELKELCWREEDKLDPTDSRRFSQVVMSHFLQRQMAKNRCLNLEKHIFLRPLVFIITAPQHFHIKVQNRFPDDI